MYNSYGRPEEVVKLQEYPVSDVGAEDVAVEMKVCAVNPADINGIQGVYPMKPTFPAVGGGEGVGVVTSTGAAVSSMKVGDWVVPARTGMLGIWRTHIVAPEKEFFRIPQDIPVNLAATLTVNPETAYRMMKIFVTLKPGDCIIQNGANSGVGQNVIQLAAAWGISTINIIRDRPNLDELRTFLLGLGANEVVTEEVAGSYKMKELVEKYNRPVLGLNCVGGKSATNLMKQLAPKAVMVTYGGMSRLPVEVSTGSLIFKDLKLVGYWNGKWLQTNAHGTEHLSMMDDLCSLAQQGKLRPPLCSEHALRDYKTALVRAMEPFVGSKQLLIMNN